MRLLLQAPTPDAEGSGATVNPSSDDLGVFMRLGPYGSVRCAARAADPEVRFHLQGEFDIATKELLAQILQAGLDSRPATVDLLQTTFIDASIVRVFVEIANARGEQARLRIANASAQLQRIFSICRLDETLVVQCRPH